MKRIQVTDEWLYQYMPVVDEAIIRELESQVDESYEFSDKFRKRMRKLCRREKYMGGLQQLQKAGKRVAVIVLIIAASLMTITMSVEAYRVRFFESVKELLGDMFRYSYQSDETAEFEKKTPSYVPEGYELVSNDGNENITFLVYQNETGAQMIFIQQYVTDGMERYCDSEYDWVERYTIAGSPLEIYRYDSGLASAYFEYGESVYTITAYEYITGDQFCRMIQEWIE